MIIVCPKCQTKLKIADEKIKPEGTKFKCPKCAVVLSVRRPAPKPVASVSAPAPAAPRPVAPLSASTPVSAPRPAPIARSFEALKPSPKPVVPAPKPVSSTARKVLVAHENPNVTQRIGQALGAMGLTVIMASDGVQVIISALKEQAALVFVDPAISKINGFEIAKRLKDRPELKGIKVILVSSTHDPARMKRSLSTAPEVDAYIDEDEIGSGLPAVIRGVFASKTVDVSQAPPAAPAPTVKPASATPNVIPEVDAGEEDAVKKAKRLARTVLSDIALYNPDKVAKAIHEGTFEQTFEGDLKEGLKHYNNRVPEDIRARKDYYKEAIANFIETKKRATRTS